MSTDIKGNADVYLQVDGTSYSYTQLQQAVRYAKERGKLDILTPNSSSGNGDGCTYHTSRELVDPYGVGETDPRVHNIAAPEPAHTVFEVDAPPPVTHVGQNFKYLRNPSLPRGDEAGDDYTSLKLRVATLEGQVSTLAIVAWKLINGVS
jgi:hypothetical protein